MDGCPDQQPPVYLCSGCSQEVNGPIQKRSLWQLGSLKVCTLELPVIGEMRQETDHNVARLLSTSP
jgi:hypothetical protein